MLVALFMIMSSQKYLNEMKKIQVSLLNFIKKDSNTDDNFQKLQILFEDIKLRSDQHKLKSLLHLLLKIADNHHRFPDFFSKIEKIFLNFENEIKKYYSNTEIFNIFKSNKRLLLFLLESKIIIMDRYIITKITTDDKYINANYCQYFYPEILPFVDEKWFPKKILDQISTQIPEDFYEKRKIGENDNIICQLIRKDNIDDFVSYIKKNKQIEIAPSIYETNLFLLKKFSQEQPITLIEYSMFYGSNQIIQYLLNKGIQLNPSYAQFAIHSSNMNVINFFENHHIKLGKECLKESIKCHHNSIVKYILNNCVGNETSNYFNTASKKSLKYYNFRFIQNEYDIASLIKYDYYLLLDNVLKNSDVDINEIIFYNIIWVY